MRPTARRVVDLLTESFFEGQAAIAAFARHGRALGRHGAFRRSAGPGRRSAIWSSLAAGDAVAAAIVFDTVEAKDWVKESLEGLVPVPAGRFVVHGQHDRANVPPNKLGIEIEAALAFGTGHHGTTRGCLLLLDQVLNARMPRRVLDLGSGTGVLAIAAAKALRRRILASDIDPHSAAVARDNARLNGVGNLVETICATGFAAPAVQGAGAVRPGAGQYPGQSAEALATPMAAHLAPWAMVILSGLLPHQAGGVIAAYRARGLVLRRRLQIEGWSSLLLQRVA